MSDRIDKIHEVRDRLDKVSPSFCLAKSLQTTLHLQTGRTHSCHHPHSHKIPLAELKDNKTALHNTLEKKQARREMLKGIRPEECDYCWNIEDSAKNSLSDRHMKSADDWARPFFDEVKTAPWDTDFVPTYLEVSFDNICNMKCAYCSPDISSSWMEEIKKFGTYRAMPGMAPAVLESIGKLPFSGPAGENPYVQAFWDWWPELGRKLKVFRITGGEPLLNEETFRVLQSFIDEARPDLQFAINSNLMVPKARIDRFVESARQIIAKKHVREFQIYTSIDTWGAQAEYIRHGLRHDYFWANVEYVLRELPQAALTFMCTFNALSLGEFPQLLNHILTLKRKYSSVTLDIAYLRHPAHMSLKILLPSQLEKIGGLIELMQAGTEIPGRPGFTKYEIEKMRRLQAWTRIPEDNRWLLQNRKLFHSYFSEYDVRRGTSFLKTFPELKRFWNLCRDLPEYSDVTHQPRI